MKRSRLSILILGVLIMAGASVAVAQSAPSVQAAELNERDIRLINIAARKRLELFNQLLNELSDRDNTEFDRKELISKAYLPGESQIFRDDLVLVDDDVNPNFTKAGSAAQPNIDEYLKIFDLGYAKVTTTNTIIFTPLQIRPPVQNGKQVFVKLFFRSNFKGRHRTIQQPYQTIERVMEMRAERAGNDWQVRVVRLGFILPGEENKMLAQTKAPAADNGRSAIPNNLSINSPEVPFRQPDNGTTVTLKFNKYWLQVVQSGSVDVPVGFYERRNEAYFYDDRNSIEFRDNSNQFLFRKGLEYQGYVRLVPIVSASRPASDPVKITPQNPPQEVADTPKPAQPKPATVLADTTRIAAVARKSSEPQPKPVADKMVVPSPAPKPSLPNAARPDTAKRAVAVAEKPVIKLTPKPVYEKAPTTPVKLINTPATPPVKTPVSLPKPDTGRALAALSLPLKVNKTESTPAKPAIPVYEKKPPVKPDLTTTLTADAKKQKARLRTLGAIQVVAGLAGLAGSYVGYSGIKKDYDVYTARVDKLNAEYNAWHDLARQPTGGPLSPMSITTYGRPGIYGVYAGGGISILAVVNGIKSLSKAGKIKPKPAK
ncbi:MAG: hypothetical protein H7319_16700 [Spirosoma sp.]|nr:hypothetical protein [Spirosoma sp.]